MRVKGNLCGWGPRWLSVGAVLAALCQFPSVGAADVLWSWSFSTESGTFVTSGTFAETAGEAVFTFKSFSVSESQIAGNVGASYDEGSQPIQTMSWNGSQPTQFTRAGGVYTNGSNFYRDDDAYFYGLSAGPTMGVLFDSHEDTVTDGSLTIAPLGAPLTPTSTPSDNGTPTATATPTITLTATVTPSPTAPPPCIGDCDDNRQVTVDELVTMITIALGNADVSSCLAGDADHHNQITVDEILTAVNNALNGCAPSPEQACVASGGTVSTSLCCLSTSDFPNTCSIGACGCPRQDSHEVQVCNCGAGTCFGGASVGCVTH